MANTNRIDCPRSGNKHAINRAFPVCHVCRWEGKPEMTRTEILATHQADRDLKDEERVNEGPGGQRVGMSEFGPIAQATR